MNKFLLDPRLEAGAVFVADWPLSRLLLMDDSRYPWLVLVPRRAELSEIHDLGHAERMVLIEEIVRAAKGLKALTGAAKINVGALGNVVPQLHVHIVARNPGDAAWPGPVWGQGTAVSYEAAERDALLVRLRSQL
ncbi:MAG TPA: HIT domain-containing protein [Rhizomicrobium sp.]|jgi:diadenosine tetraphosphate (Ap4A) HIT family hydrolase